jgi:hypothetical protein
MATDLRGAIVTHDDENPKGTPMDARIGLASEQTFLTV